MLLLGSCRRRRRKYCNLSKNAKIFLNYADIYLNGPSKAIRTSLHQLLKIEFLVHPLFNSRHLFRFHLVTLHHILLSLQLLMVMLLRICCVWVQVTVKKKSFVWRRWCWSRAIVLKRWYNVCNSCREKKKAVKDILLLLRGRLDLFIFLGIEIVKIMSRPSDLRQVSREMRKEWERCWLSCCGRSVIRNCKI